jgi:hypothetical protein
MSELDVADPQQMSLEPNSDPANDPTPETPEMIALRAELVASQQRESESNARQDAVNARFDQYLSRPAAQEATQVQRVDPLSAPDPAVDPEGFSRHNAALHAQNQGDFDRRLTESNSRIEQQNQTALAGMRAEQAADRKWAEFQTAHPEHAHQEQIAKLAFAELYPAGMPRDASGVLPAVKAKMEEIIGTPTPAVNRTGGVGGGSAPPRPPAPTQEEKPPLDMVDLMIQNQIDEGLI